MGIFDFIKGAGRKEEAKRDEELNDLIRGNKLLRYVMGLGLDIEDLRVRYDDGVATVTGKAASQAEREKVVLAKVNRAEFLMDATPGFTLRYTATPSTRCSRSTTWKPKRRSTPWKRATHSRRSRRRCMGMP